jgi:hypothetical protein
LFDNPYPTGHHTGKGRIYFGYFAGQLVAVEPDIRPNIRYESLPDIRLLQKPAILFSAFSIHMPEL